MYIQNQFYPCMMCILIFPSKIWAEQCSLYMTKYGIFYLFSSILRILSFFNPIFYSLAQFENDLVDSTQLFQEWEETKQMLLTGDPGGGWFDEVSLGTQGKYRETSVFVSRGLKSWGFVLHMTLSSNFAQNYLSSQSSKLGQ